MPRPNVARQNVDIILKLTAAALGGDLFARFGLSLPPIVDALPTELPLLDVRTQHADQFFRLADESVLHLELQTTRRSGDLVRFATYHLAAFQQYGRPVHTVVLYGAGIRSVADTLETGDLTFHVQTILVGRENGATVLRRLHEKAAHGEPFTPMDRVDLILSPLMRQRRPIADVARDAARLTINLPQEQREMTVGALLGLSYPDISDDVAVAILGELGMVTLSQAFEVRGEVKGKREALRIILQERFGALPQDVERRIASAEAEQLDALIKRAVTVDGLEKLAL